MTIETALSAYRKTIAHLPPAEQMRRIARRVESLRAEFWASHLIEAQRAGIDAGFNLAYRVRAAF